MRFLVSVVALVLFLAMAFSSCTCLDRADPPIAIEDSDSESRSQASSPAVTATRQAVTPTQVAETATPEVRPTLTPPSQIPADFPSEVPVIPGSTLAQVQDLANNARNVLFTSEKSVPELVQTYQDTLTKAGWRITQQFTRDQHAFATYEKDKMLVNVTVVTDFEAPGQQIIAVMYEEQKPLEFEEDPGLEDE